MPHLKLSNPTTNSCDYEVLLSSPFNTTYYKELRITSTNYGSSTSNVSGYVVSVIAKSSSSQYVTGKITDGMSAGRTYTLYAYAQAQNGTWYLAGSATITMLNAPTSKTLNMPTNYNQFYTGNPADFTGDCFCCSCANCASYYRGTPYTLQNTIDDEAYAADGFYKSRIRFASFTTYTAATTESAICQKIREEINQNRPVIVHYGKGTYIGHYVTAFKYINGGQTYSDFYVLDSGNWSNKSSSTGLISTIPDAKTNNKVGNVDFLELTNKK